MNEKHSWRDRRLMLVIMVSLAAVGWFASQSGEGLGQPAANAPAAGAAAAASATAPPAPAVLTLKTGAGDAIDATRLLSLNYDDTEKKFTITTTFTDPGNGGSFSLSAADGAIPIITFNVQANDTLANQLAKRTIDLGAIFDQQPRELIATWLPTGGSQQISQPLKVKIDTHGPMLDNVDLLGDPAVALTLVLTFADDDLDRGTASKADNYEIIELDQNGQPGPPVSLTDDKVSIDHKVVRLALGRLYTGSYQITVNGTKQLTSAGGATVKPLMDTSGNLAGGRGSKGNDQTRRFSSLPSAEQGPRIEFPEFLPTAPQPKPDRRANPADNVQTRVVRLYYYRDAARVAQIINRTVKSYNRAAVTQAQQRAEDARTRADQATDQRRHDEREAVRAATELRQAEHDLADAQQKAADAAQQIPQVQSQLSELGTQQNSLNSHINSANQTISSFQQQSQPAGTSAAQAEELPAPTTQPSANAEPAGRSWKNVYRRLTFQSAPSTTPASPATPAQTQTLPQAQANLASLQAQLKANVQSQGQLNNRLTDLNAAVNQVQVLQSKVATLSAQAATANETSLTDADKEERAREDQFRQEVAAAHTDPDTYAPAKLDSVDPVAQVSVSVIGEGLLQLRGPLKGILEIKSMIADEIDAPVGQVKVDVVTVQVNGEKGERMEKPVGMIDAHLGLGRFLTAHSLVLMRRAVQIEAARIAMEADRGGHYQVDRDRKYLYSFFGRDYIDELYQMDSEFLHTENMILSLHSMDTISLHRALFILALAKNDVRERIIANFMQLVQTDLVQAEFDYRRASELKPYKSKRWLPHHDYPDYEACTFEAVQRNAVERYHFTNFRSFFENSGCGDANGDTMTPAQREFIRLAQIFKSRLMAEVELKQRIIERTLVEDDRELDIEREQKNGTVIRQLVLDSQQATQRQLFKLSGTLAEELADLDGAIAAGLALSGNLTNAAPQAQAAAARARDAFEVFNPSAWSEENRSRTLRQRDEILQSARAVPEVADRLRQGPRTAMIQQQFDELDTILDRLKTVRKNSKYDDLMALGPKTSPEKAPVALLMIGVAADPVEHAWRHIAEIAKLQLEVWNAVLSARQEFERHLTCERFDWTKASADYQKLYELLQLFPRNASQPILASLKRVRQAGMNVNKAMAQYENARCFLAKTRSPLDQKKLLDLLIDEKHEKYIDILEGTRANIAAIDNYLKRLAIALEDDFKVQFYEPAFVRIRRAARQWDVTLGQVERTSILTNNRAFAKVSPEATMEFDLPKRDIALVETLKGAQALTQDMGALLNDPTFLSTFKMMGGGPPPGKVQNMLPSLPSSTDEQRLGHTSDPQRPIGSSLEALIPDPAIYKFETGTGYEIRPVIQPDGDSIVYDFTYLYTTNVREPVRADEKHLGRVKQHFVNTQVQTTSFELREVSRYQVALKAARTGQGVPLLQGIPIAGVLFRPLPSAQSSIQENIILAQCVVYPTLFDLMGLRWAPSIVDLDHVSVRDTGHVVRGRNQALINSIFDMTSNRVDEMLNLKADSPENDRPDLHRRHVQASPYHPGGYSYPGKVDDPSGEGFQIPDRRPAEMRDPPYDRRFRRPIRYEEVPDAMQYERIPGTGGEQQREDGDSHGPHFPQGDSRRSRQGIVVRPEAAGTGRSALSQPSARRQAVVVKASARQGRKNSLDARDVHSKAQTPSQDERNRWAEPKKVPRSE